MHMHLQQTESCLSAPPAATPPPRDQWDLQPNRTQHQNWRLASRDRRDARSNRRQAPVTPRWTEEGEPLCLRCNSTCQPSRTCSRQQNDHTTWGGGPDPVSHRTPVDHSWRPSPCPSRHRSCQNPHGRPYIFKTVCEIRTAFTTTANRHSVRAGPHPLPVISETELHLTDTGTIKVLVAKDFSHELLGSDTISQGQGKIDFARRELTCFGKSFQITPYTDSLPATVLVHAAVVTTW